MAAIWSDFGRRGEVERAARCSYLATAVSQKSGAMVVQDLVPWGRGADVMAACGNQKTRNCPEIT